MFSSIELMRLRASSAPPMGVRREEMPPTPPQTPPAPPQAPPTHPVVPNLAPEYRWWEALRLRASTKPAEDNDQSEDDDRKDKTRAGLPEAHGVSVAQDARQVSSQMLLTGVPEAREMSDLRETTNRAQSRPSQIKMANDRLDAERDEVPKAPHDLPAMGSEGKSKSQLSN